MQKAVLFLFLIVLLSGCAKRNSIFPKNTSIDGIDVSGKSRAAVERALFDKHRSLLSQLSFTLHTECGDAEFTAEELGAHYATENAINTALRDGGDIQTELLADSDSVSESVTAKCKDLRTEPTPASAEYDGNGEFIFHEGRAGREVDTDAVTELLCNAVRSKKSGTYEGITKDIPPTGTDVEQLKKENVMISEFTTFFNHSPLNAENRVNNIKKAAELVNGTRLESGEEFNTNAVLGDRNKENGWYTAPGIVNGKYEQEYGGGVCQISTTLYNSVLLANLTVVERTPHSIPVSYVDLGRDATISTGGPNFRFINSMKKPVTIAATIDKAAESVTIRIFGEKPDDYARVEITSEQTGYIAAPDPEYVKDASLRYGEYVLDRKARDGKRSATYRSFFDESGNLLKTETVSKDTYTAFAAIVLYNW